MKLVCVAASVLVLSVGVAAQGNSGKGNGKPVSAITLSLGGLQCTTPIGTDAFRVQAWSWGASNSGNVGNGGGAGAGKANLQDLSVSKAFDSCSPALFGGTVTGKAFQALTLTQSNSDGTVTTVSLTDVRVTSWSAGGSTASEAPSENVTFGFAKACLADGASGARFCFDVAANKTF